MSAFINWSKLQEVHEAARKAMVSYTMRYVEAEDSFAFSIRSIAPSENWDGQEYSFDTAVNAVLNQLDNIMHKTGDNQ